MSRKPPVTASLSLEQALWARGRRFVVGLDEAGRGAWAGPVAAGAVCFAPHADTPVFVSGVNDSKKLSAGERARLAPLIESFALAWGIGSATAQEIDEFGIVSASCLAMERALADLIARFPRVKPDHLLLDSIRWSDPGGRNLPHQSFVRGDGLSLSIAAASILAKVWRDQTMMELETLYPNYGFAKHKGYGVPSHFAALRQHGVTPQHRMTFHPMCQPELL